MIEREEELIMETEGGTMKKTSSMLTWIKRQNKSGATKSIISKKSKSWSRGERPKVAPIGYFSVYVGPEKQRFIIKTNLINHPLFKMLLEDAELEYGFQYCDGPLLLPCHVDHFLQVLAEMECGDDLLAHLSHRFSNAFSPRSRRRFGGYAILTSLRSFG